MKISVSCELCHEKTILEVEQSQLDDWRNGVLIQDAMPQLSNSERELLISGTCEKCWNDIFRQVVEADKFTGCSSAW
ncbi:MAG: hypothetical protein RLZZ44_485 [Bacteroidota bacterium]